MNALRRPHRAALEFGLAARGFYQGTFLLRLVLGDEFSFFVIAHFTPAVAAQARTRTTGIASPERRGLPIAPTKLTGLLPAATTTGASSGTTARLR